MPDQPLTPTAIIAAESMHLTTAGEQGDHAGHLIALHIPAHHQPTRPNRVFGQSAISYRVLLPA